MIHFPLQLRFKILAFSPQIFVEDATGKLCYYVRQKFFKLKESVKVFSDIEQMNLVMQIDADRIIDFSAHYIIRSAGGKEVGSVRRSGMRSLWRAHYELSRHGSQFATIQEANPWVKLLDGLFGEIPLIGLLSAYILHPTYNVTRADGTLLFRLQKRPSFFEKCFSLERVAALNEEEEECAVMALLMMVLLERARG